MLSKNLAALLQCLYIFSFSPIPLGRFLALSTLNTEMPLLHVVVVVTLTAKWLWAEFTL